MSILSNSLVGNAGTTFSEFHLKLRFNTQKVYSSLDQIAEALEKSAENYGTTDKSSADNISAHGAMADMLRGQDSGSDNSSSNSTGTHVADVPEKVLLTLFENASPEDRREMIKENPELYAWLDGIPSAHRHEANMILLEDYVSDNPDDSDAQSLLNQVKKDDLMLLGFAPPEYETRFRDHPPSRVSDMSFITATDNPDHANTQVVNMGGTNSDKNWDYSSSQIERAERLRDVSLADGQSPEEIVGIAYVGTEFPNDAEALDQSFAREGAQDFYDFTSGLKETHQGPDAPRQVWDVHSYSSITASYADQISENTPADAIIYSGGAGPGGAVDSASELNVGAENVYVAQSDDDWITWAADDVVHGQNLAGPDFGAVRIDAGDGGHSSYWQPGEVALENKGKIINGEEPTTVDYYGLSEEEKREALRDVRRP